MALQINKTIADINNDINDVQKYEVQWPTLILMAITPVIGWILGGYCLVRYNTALDKLETTIRKLTKMDLCKLPQALATTVNKYFPKLDPHHNSIFTSYEKSLAAREKEVRNILKILGKVSGCGNSTEIQECATTFNLIKNCLENNPVQTRQMCKEWEQHNQDYKSHLREDEPIHYSILLQRLEAAVAMKGIFGKDWDDPDFKKHIFPIYLNFQGDNLQQEVFDLLPSLRDVQDSIGQPQTLPDYKLNCAQISQLMHWMNVNVGNAPGERPVDKLDYVIKLLVEVAGCENSLNAQILGMALSQMHEIFKVYAPLYADFLHRDALLKLCRQAKTDDAQETFHVIANCLENNPDQTTQVYNDWVQHIRDYRSGSRQDEPESYSSLLERLEKLMVDKAMQDLFGKEMWDAPQFKTTFADSLRDNADIEKTNPTLDTWINNTTDKDVRKWIADTSKEDGSVRDMTPQDKRRSVIHTLIKVAQQEIPIPNRI